jgi:hypothetical protein
MIYSFFTTQLSILSIMKNLQLNSFLSILAMVAFFTVSQAQSLQFNAVHTLQYSLSGFGSESAPYTVPTGMVAKVVDVAATGFCFQTGTSSTVYNSARMVLNGFQIPLLQSTICGGATNGTLFKVPLDQWMKAGDEVALRLPNLSHGAPSSPNGSFLLTVIEYVIVP